MGRRQIWVIFRNISTSAMSNHKLRSQQTPWEIIHTGLGKFLELKNYELFFFGSRATGKIRPGSDRDIGIVGKEKIAPRLLHRIRSYFDKTPLSVDIVDFTERDTEFKRLAFETRVGIY